MSKRLTSHHLISRNTDGSNTLCVDFDPHVIRFFHEVNYWERQNFDMPYSKDVIELASNAEKLRVLRQTIGLVVRDFNAIVLKLNEEELALFGERIFFVERKLKPGIDKLTWASKPQILQTYAKDCRRYCNEVYQTAIKFKANHRTIMENCPSTRPNRVSVCVARTLNPIGQARVTLSARYEQLRAVCGPRQEEEVPEIRPKRFSQAAR